MNTSLDSLRNVCVRLRDASASVPGGFWAIVVDSFVMVLVDGIACWAMLRTRLSDDLVRRINMAVFEVFDEVQLRFRPLIGLLVVRWRARLGAVIEEDEEEAKEDDGVA